MTWSMLQGVKRRYWCKGTYYRCRLSNRDLGPELQNLQKRNTGEECATGGFLLGGDRRNTISRNGGKERKRRCDDLDVSSIGGRFGVSLRGQFGVSFSLGRKKKPKGGKKRTDTKTSLSGKQNVQVSAKARANIGKEKGSESSTKKLDRGGVGVRSTHSSPKKTRNSSKVWRWKKPNSIRDKGG